MGRAFFLRADGIFALPSGVAPADGDYGDITVTSSGATWTIDNGVVTYAKMQNVSATQRVLGRITAGAGVVEELTGANLVTIIGSSTWQPLSAVLTAYAGGDTPSAFTLGIVDSVDAAAWRTAIGAGTSTVTPAALTKTDDTNVTATLGGTPATALLQATSLTLGWTGQLSVARGGTAALDASGARTNLGLAIGSNVQAYSAVLGAYAGGDTPSAFTLGIVDSVDAAAWRTAIGAQVAGSYQPLSAVLTAYAGGDTPSAFTLGIVDSVDAAAWRTAIGAGTSTVTPAALTKADDTNVTLTLGGTPATALLQASSITAGWTGTLAETRGGTGAGTYTTGDILYASAANTLSKLAIGSSTNVLTVTGGVPVWAAAPGGASGANPSATIGLAAVNGAAVTFLRSDGAPALDQDIVPTWTNQHVFSRAGAALILGSASNTTFLDIRDSANSSVLRAGSAFSWLGSGSTTDASLGWRGTNLNFYGSNGVRLAAQFSLAAMQYGNSTDNPSHTFYGNITATTPIITKGYTVAGLPAGTTGMIAHVTDALAPTFLAAVVGGGAIKTLVFYNGANWVAS